MEENNTLISSTMVSLSDGDVFNTSVNTLSLNTTGYNLHTLNSSQNVVIVDSSNYMGTSKLISGSSLWIGDSDEKKHKIYIVEPWQSSNPIKIDEGFWISLERDIVSTDDLKIKILKKLEDTHPEVILTTGLNIQNIKLVKSEFNLEINKEFGVV
jgi:hypothetical protein